MSTGGSGRPKVSDRRLFVNYSIAVQHMHTHTHTLSPKIVSQVLKNHNTVLCHTKYAYKVEKLDPTPTKDSFQTPAAAAPWFPSVCFKKA